MASLHENQTLLASAAQTASSTGESAVRLLDGARRARTHIQGIQFVLDLTAAATEVGDLLDVYVQTKLDDTNWVDIVHFSQCVGNGGALRYFEKITAGAAQAGFEDGDALAAGSVRNLMGDQYRVRFAITDAGTDNASFTFSVAAVLL